MKGLIIVLGAPNSDSGELSEIAVNRQQAAMEFYTNNPGYKICCTGGIGAHFNNTSQPHALYAKRYLVKNGIPEAAVLEPIPSRNTIEDAELSLPLIEKYKPENIAVITSDFHIERARIIFNHYLKGQNLIFIPAASTIDPEQLKPLIEHERLAVGRLKEKWDIQ